VFKKDLEESQRIQNLMRFEISNHRDEIKNLKNIIDNKEKETDILKKVSE